MGAVQFSNCHVPQSGKTVVLEHTAAEDSARGLAVDGCVGVMNRLARSATVGSGSDAGKSGTEEPVLNPFSRQTGANVNPQMLISDPAAVNNLRGGGTSTWDVINLNNSWQRNQLFPEGPITPLDKDKFAPLFDMNVAGFQWPYHWALDESGEQEARQAGAANLAACAGGGEADRRAVRHRARDQRRGRRAAPRDAP